MMNKPVISILFIHLAGWLLFFSFFLLFASEAGQGQSPVTLFTTKEFLWFALTYLFIFYFNHFFLFKWLYLKKHYAAYVSLFFVLLAAVYFLKPFDNLVHNMASLRAVPTLSFGDPIAQNSNIGSAPLSRKNNIDIVSLVVCILIWLMGMATQIIGRWRIVEEKAAKAESEKVKAELAFLKAQINPHFLFNSLNNIYSLAVSNNPATADSIMKLSKIMRYITDEMDSDSVPLQSEIDCISDYIELQRLRLSKKVDLNFSATGDISSKNIAPLILIPFVENVFKYGISNHEPCNITIRLHASKSGIEFYCRNKIFPLTKHLESTGIGINNTGKRIKLVYDAKSKLDITKNNGFFNVELFIRD